MTRLIAQHLHDSGLHRQLCLVEDITKLRVKDKKKTAKEEAVESAAKDFVDALNRDSHCGGSNITNAHHWLEDYCEPNLIPYDEWARTKTAEELQLCLDDEVKTFDKKSPITYVAC